MPFRMRLIQVAVDHPKWVMGVTAGITVVLILLAGLPSLAPSTFSMLHPVTVDTDPENMLSADEPVRVFHDRMKRALALHDMVVLGVVNEEHPNGVFNVESLQRIYELTEYAKTLRGKALGVDDPNAGVIEVDLIAPSVVDNIEQGQPGEVRFEWLMPTPPNTDEEAIAVRDKARNIPFLNGTLLSEDGKAVCLYLPLTSKALSYRVYRALRSKTLTFEKEGGGDRYFITGLPVAEDTFGVEMFIQMAISAPAAMVVIFLLMLFFFRKLVLIVSPLILAVVVTVWTMCGLVIGGYTIHIMSSMIPIFLMPISVLNSIHILSEFFERYQGIRDRKKTVLSVMNTLFMPMLYTSLTTVAGFASLGLTPIPPVQVFGIFVGIGIAVAWVLTMTFLPAYVMLISENRLAAFGTVHTQDGHGTHSKTPTGRLLQWAGGFTYSRAQVVLGITAAVVAVAAYGIMQIRVNDNPTKWFRRSHPIRVADHVLNEHFAGTYMAYFALSPIGEMPEEVQAAPAAPPSAAPDAGAGPGLPAGLGDEGTDGPDLPAGLGDPTGAAGPDLPAGLGGEPAVEAPPRTAAGAGPSAAEIFKEPEVLRYIEGLQAHLLTTDAVGKSNSITDIVKTVHRELIDGTEASFRIPDTSGAVAQCLLQFLSSHRPGDLWHFVTPDYRHTSIWVQLRSGDNLDMQKVVEAVDEYVERHPLRFEIGGAPVELELNWFGLTYINVVWQEKMVKGMLVSFLSSFLVVFLMMVLLFRSGLWGLMSMVPLTVTIGFIYGVIGLVGKDYDMPVAVLSSLTLGLAIDFAIHFLERGRVIYEEAGSWEAAYPRVFGEPARAIAKNVVVIAVGFLPLLLAPLVPYNTVGVFMAAILGVSGVGTLLIMPALIRLLEPLMFPKTKLCRITCRCGTCTVTGITAVVMVWVNVVQFIEKGVTTLTIVSLAVLPVIAVLCCLMSRRAVCSIDPEQNP